MSKVHIQGLGLFTLCGIDPMFAPKDFQWVDFKDRNMGTCLTCLKKAAEHERKFSTLYRPLAQSQLQSAA